MKKYFSFVLAGLFLMALPMLISSCKDTDEDAINELRLDHLTDIAKLQLQIDELAGKICQCTPGQGVPGPQGPQGAQGDKGDKGDTGATGAQGDKGDTGAQGEKGDKGDTGAQGDKGDKGDTGAQGDKGDKGDTPVITIDEDGNWCVDGVSLGKPAVGKSAYEIAKANGFVGTEAEWLESLKGAQGEKGETGATGAQGEKGETGATGAQGEKGDKGDAGATINLKEIDKYGKDENGNFWIKFVGDDVIYSTASCNEPCAYAIKVIYSIQEAFGYNNGQLTDAEIAKFQGDIKKALQDIKDALNYIKSLKQRVTSISIDGVNNNVFGMVKTSADVQTNMLFGFYGSVEQAFNFPSTNPAYYGDASVILNDANVTLATEQIKAEDIYSEELGTIYASINPAQIDFTGIDASLVNSQNKTNGVVLTPAAVSAETLKMGYTRPITRAADAEYGFYEFIAKVDDYNAVEKIEINVNDYIDLGKALKNGSNGERITALATAIRNTLGAFKTDAYALKVSAEDSLATVDGVNHVVKSGYDIQAALVKPVGYKVCADNIPTSMPGYNKTVNLVNRVVKWAVEKAQNSNIMSDVDKIKLDIQNIQGSIKHIEFKKNGSDSDIIVTITTATNNGDDHVTINITNADLEKLYTSLNKDVADINKMLDNLNEACDDGIKFLDKITTDDLVSDAQNGADKFIDKVWAKLDKYYTAIEDRFELCLAVNDGGKIKFIHRSAAHATSVSSSFTLIMTNLNAELITPAYKKHVVVTDAWGAADKAAAIAAANSTLNKVVPGNQQKIAVDGLQSGVVYEISYSGLDYAGKQETRTFYVKCK